MEADIISYDYEVKQIYYEIANILVSEGRRATIWNVFFVT